MDYRPTIPSNCRREQYSTRCMPLSVRYRVGALPHRAGEMIREVGGLGLGGPSRKRVPKCLKGPKTTYTTFAIAKKQSKRSKKGPFCYILGPPPGPTQEMELMGPGGGRSLPVPPVSPAMLPHSTLWIYTGTHPGGGTRPLLLGPKKTRFSALFSLNYVIFIFTARVLKLFAMREDRGSLQHGKELV